MSRPRLREALARRRGGPPALVPLVESHAARLEQLPDAAWPDDADAQARMLRVVRGLYDLDAVTIAGGGGLVAAAAWAAAQRLSGSAARARVAAATALQELPEPAEVAAAAVLSTARDVLRRLRGAFNEQAGVAYVLPQPERLCAQLARPADTGWASDVLGEVVRTLGADEPDLVMFLGDAPEVDAGFESLLEFFGVPLVCIGPAPTPGVLCLDPLPVDAEAAPRGTWLVSTRAEIAADADPQRLRERLARMR